MGALEQRQPPRSSSCALPAPPARLDLRLHLVQGHAAGSSRPPVRPAPGGAVAGPTMAEQQPSGCQDQSGRLGARAACRRRRGGAEGRLCSLCFIQGAMERLLERQELHVLPPAQKVRPASGGSWRWPPLGRRSNAAECPGRSLCSLLLATSTTCVCSMLQGEEMLGEPLDVDKAFPE